MEMDVARVQLVSLLSGTLSLTERWTVAQELVTGEVSGAELVNIADTWVSRNAEQLYLGR